MNQRSRERKRVEVVAEVAGLALAWSPDCVKHAGKCTVTTLVLASILGAAPRHKERYVEGTFPLIVNQTCKLTVGNGKGGLLLCDKTVLCSLSQISAMKTGEVVPHHYYLTVQTDAKTYGTFELGKDDGGIVVLLTLAM
jgi:hypothetical protein